MKPIDALHVACAEAADVAVFLTCDDDIVKRSSNADMNVTNPVYFVLEEATDRDGRQDDQ